MAGGWGTAAHTPTNAAAAAAFSVPEAAAGSWAEGAVPGFCLDLVVHPWLPWARCCCLQVDSVAGFQEHRASSRCLSHCCSSTLFWEA